MNDCLAKSLSVTRLIINASILRCEVSHQKKATTYFLYHFLNYIFVVDSLIEEKRGLSAFFNSTFYSLSNGLDISTFLLIHRHRNKYITRVL